MPSYGLLGHLHTCACEYTSIFYLLKISFILSIVSSIWSFIVDQKPHQNLSRKEKWISCSDTENAFPK